MTSNLTAASATPPPAKQAAMTGLPARGGTAPGTPGTGPAPRRRRWAGAALAMLAVPLAATALTAIPADAATGPYANAATIRVGYNPDAVAVNPSTHTVYVANSSGNTLSVIKGLIVTATIGVGYHPDAVGVDPSTDTVYVVNRNDLTSNENYNSTVSVINGATGRVTATIGVGVMADAVAVDPSTHTAYVANYDSDSVSVINQIGGVYQVTATIGVGSPGARPGWGWTRPRIPPMWPTNATAPCR